MALFNDIKQRSHFYIFHINKHEQDTHDTHDESIESLKTNLGSEAYATVLDVCRPKMDEVPEMKSSHIYDMSKPPI
jgi:hypothetical protein